MRLIASILILLPGVCLATEQKRFLSRNPVRIVNGVIQEKPPQSHLKQRGKRNLMTQKEQVQQNEKLRVKYVTLIAERDKKIRCLERDLAFRQGLRAGQLQAAKNPLRAMKDTFFATNALVTVLASIIILKQLPKKTTNKE